jgi:predicted alpha/beta-hydrolase family hydrolase
MVLTHGAGANCRSALLVAVAEALAARGVTVLRYDLPFRQKRPFGPPSPATAAVDRSGLQDALETLRTLVPGSLLLGGHSYGGRQASMLAAEQPGLVNGLLLLSYPLHPPGKPDKPRTAHFPAWTTRAAFVHGDRDEFGTLEEMRDALATLPPPPQLSPKPAAGHDLKKGRFDPRPALDFLL